MGSAAIAHSAVRRRSRLQRGSSLLEPFIDTVVIMTALVIIITGKLQFDEAQAPMFWAAAPLTLGGAGGVDLTSAAFASHHGSLTYWRLRCLVAFSTMISWSYYGQSLGLPVW